MGVPTLLPRSGGGIFRCSTVNPASELNSGAATDAAVDVGADGSSMVTRIRTCGSSAGRKPTNDATYLPSAYPWPPMLGFCAVPVLPATS